MLFDGLILLSRGALCYFGPGRDAPCAFFGAQGFTHPSGQNVAEYLLETISSSTQAAAADAEASAVHDFVAYYARSELCAQQTRAVEAVMAANIAVDRSALAVAKRWCAVPAGFGQQRGADACCALQGRRIRCVRQPGVARAAGAAALSRSHPLRRAAVPVRSHRRVHRAGSALCLLLFQPGSSSTRPRMYPAADRTLARLLVRSWTCGASQR